jgi:hypothetical protein
LLPDWPPFLLCVAGRRCPDVAQFRLKIRWLAVVNFLMCDIYTGVIIEECTRKVAANWAPLFLRPCPITCLTPILKNTFSISLGTALVNNSPAPWPLGHDHLTLSGKKTGER